MAKKISPHLYKQANAIKTWGDTPANLWGQSLTVACPPTWYFQRSAHRGSCASSLWSLKIIYQNLGLQGRNKLKNPILGYLWPSSLFVTSCDQFLVTKILVPRKLLRIARNTKKSNKIFDKFLWANHYTGTYSLVEVLRLDLGSHRHLLQRLSPSIVICP